MATVRCRAPTRWPEPRSRSGGRCHRRVGLTSAPRPGPRAPYTRAGRRGLGTGYPAPTLGCRPPSAGSIPRTAPHARRCRFGSSALRPDASIRAAPAAPGPARPPHALAPHARAPHAGSRAPDARPWARRTWPWTWPAWTCAARPGLARSGFRRGGRGFRRGGCGFRPGGRGFRPGGRRPCARALLPGLVRGVTAGVVPQSRLDDLQAPLGAGPSGELRPRQHPLHLFGVSLGELQPDGERG